MRLPIVLVLSNDIAVKSDLKIAHKDFNRLQYCLMVHTRKLLTNQNYIIISYILPQIQKF